MSKQLATVLTVLAIAIPSLDAPLGAQGATSSQAPAPPGRLVDVGGHRLHLLCAGEGSPAVILESGLGANSVDWALVQPTVGKLTRACAYDRAGYAWSDPGAEPRGLRVSVEELHLLFAAAEVKPPYVLVGQSWGGRIVRLFAHVYPQEVAGLVLIDTYSEGSAEVAPGVLAGLDLREEAAPDPEANLPARLRSAYEWASGRPRVADISDPDEPDAAMQSTTAASKIPLGDKPLVVISAGRLSWEAEERAGGKSLRDELRSHVMAEAFLATLSRNSRFLVARKSFHKVHLYEPELVAGAIGQVVAAVRSGNALSPAAPR